MAVESLAQLADSGISVGTVVTDGDSAAFKAAMDRYLSGLADEEPRSQFDVVHINRNQRKFIKKQEFTSDAFSGTNVPANKIQARLAIDLTKRCHGEHVAAYRECGGDIGKTLKKMSYMAEYLPKCYQGDHSQCGRKSNLCRGLKDKNWLTKSVHIPKNLRMKLLGKDLETFQNCIIYRLGKQILEKTQELRTTQKCEATNRAISARVPKLITFSRNYLARIHSAVKALNCGIGQAMYDQLIYIGAQVPKGSRIAKGLKKLQDKERRRREHDSNPIVIAKRAQRIKRKYAALDAQRAELSYKSGMALSTESVPEHMNEHSYTTRRKYRKLE